MTWAFSRLVDPVRPRGTPAVMTTVSPFCTSPSFSVTSAPREKIRSVEFTSPVRRGITPQSRLICRRTFSYMVRAATGQAGRKREIIRAVWPELVAVTMALALRSMAVRQQVWVMASLILAVLVNWVRIKRCQ